MFGPLSLLPQRLDWLFSEDEARGRVFPAVNLWEDSDTLHLEAELPGFTIDDLEVAVLNQELTIRGERKPVQQEGWTCHRNERLHGAFVRTLALPVAVDAEQVNATLKDGVLQIVMPKRTEAKLRRIEVKRIGNK